MARGTATAPPPSEAAEGPPEEQGAIQVAEGRAAAAEERAGAAEAALGKTAERLDAIEARLQAAPAPTPVGEKSAPALKPPEQRIRGFVSPQHPNSEFLIKVGVVQKVRDPNSPTGYRDHAREGDIKIKFQGGAWKSVGESGSEQDRADDQVRIAWCEAHPEIARDVLDPTTPVWFSIKEGQMETSRKPSSFSRTIDVDAALAGDVSKLGGVGGDVVDQMRRQVEGANRGA